GDRYHGGRSGRDFGDYDCQQSAGGYNSGGRRGGGNGGGGSGRDGDGDYYDRGDEDQQQQQRRQWRSVRDVAASTRKRADTVARQLRADADDRQGRALRQQSWREPGPKGTVLAYTMSGQSPADKRGWMQ
ncbi:unnamed protein product, partial [Phaeothamnion confervicola]